MQIEGTKWYSTKAYQQGRPVTPDSYAADFIKRDVQPAAAYLGKEPMRFELVVPEGMQVDDLALALDKTAKRQGKGFTLTTLETIERPGSSPVLALDIDLPHNYAPPEWFRGAASTPVPKANRGVFHTTTFGKATPSTPYGMAVAVINDLLHPLLLQHPDQTKRGLTVQLPPNITQREFLRALDQLCVRDSSFDISFGKQLASAQTARFQYWWMASPDGLDAFHDSAKPQGKPGT